MGGRGSASGMSDKGRSYGTEYTTLHQSGNIKFVRYKDSSSAKTPQETMTRGRVYVTVNKANEPVSVTYYDNVGKRAKQIDLKHFHKGEKPHTHLGYTHDEGGTSKMTSEEKVMVERIKKLWLNRGGK